VDLAEALQVAVQPGPQPEAAPADGAPASIPCRVAVVVFEDAQRRFQRFSFLVLLLAGLFVAAAVATLVLFLVVDDATGEGFLSLVIAILTGPGAAFVKSERDKARDDRNSAQGVINSQCGEHSPAGVLQAMGVEPGLGR
jgi:hypothetical protein